MKNTTVWRNQSTNQAPKAGLGYTSIVRRSAIGYTWLLMMQDQCVAHGMARTQLACREAVKLAKAAREKGVA